MRRDAISDNIETGEALKKKVTAPDDLINMDTIYFGSLYLAFHSIFYDAILWQSTSGIKGYIQGAMNDQAKPQSVNKKRVCMKLPQRVMSFAKKYVLYCGNTEKFSRLAHKD